MRITKQALCLAWGLISLSCATNLLNAATTSGVMKANETWSGVVTLTGDVIVPDKVTLTILPGTRVECWDKYDDQAGGTNASRIELIVNQGNLSAVGTSNAPIVFTSSPNVLPARAGDWYGIRFLSGSNSTQVLEWSIIEYGTIGVRVERGSPTLEHCFFRTNAECGLVAFQPVTISSCQAQGNRWGFAFQPEAMVFSANDCLAYGNETGFSSGGVLYLRGCVSTNNSWTGIAAAGLDATNCLVARNGWGGIAGTSYGQIKVTSCQIVENYGDPNHGFGISASYGSLVAIDSLIASNAAHGLLMNPGAVTVKNCTISHNHGPAIFAQNDSSSPSLIVESRIYNNGGGIDGRYLSLRDSTILANAGAGVSLVRPMGEGILRNQIARNDIGIRLGDDAANGNILNLVNNSITTNTQYEICNQGSAAVIATNNFWGEPTTAELTNNVRNLTKVFDSQDDAKVGQVVLKPYLPQDPDTPHELPPVINPGTPADLVVAQGATATFTVNATSGSPMTYQWRKGDSNLAGQTTPTLAFTTQLSDTATNYNVIVSNSGGSATSRWATLTVLVPPSISGQPADQSLPAGATARFHVTATGSTPLAYQWQKGTQVLADDGRVSGATTPDLSLSAIQASDVGNYRCVVTNNVGASTSGVAHLTLLTPPSFVQQPVSQIVLVGGSASFTVTLTGSEPFSYQWFFNHALIPDGTNATYAIPCAATNCAGLYSVTVSNAAGSTNSVVATLGLDTVETCAAITLYGPVGTPYRIEWSDALATNTWFALTNLTLSTTPQTVLDWNSTHAHRRFYRVTQQ